MSNSIHIEIAICTAVISCILTITAMIVNALHKRLDEYKAAEEKLEGARDGRIEKYEARCQQNFEKLDGRMQEIEKRLEVLLDDRRRRGTGTNPPK